VLVAVTQGAAVDPVERLAATELGSGVTYRILQGDCITRLRELPADSIDAIVTDPPAGINFMNREWDHHKGGMNPWVEWMTEVMREALRVCKPGAHALVWALPRTSHWTGSALELAGWQVRDVVTHLFGSGFPKSHNLDGGLGTALKPAAEFWWLARKPLGMTVEACTARYGTGALNIDACRVEGTPSTYRERVIDAGLGRWPSNVLLGHPEGCVPTGTRRVKGHAGYPNGPGGSSSQLSQKGTPTTRTGPWAGHADADGLETVTAWECEPGCPVRMLDEQTGNLGRSAGTQTRGNGFGGGLYEGGGLSDERPVGFGDSGGASRFFAQFNHTEEPQRFRYQSKSSSAERNAGLDGFEPQGDAAAMRPKKKQCNVCGTRAMRPGPTATEGPSGGHTDWSSHPEA
jgi:hypothetical protein